MSSELHPSPLSAYVDTYLTERTCASTPVPSCSWSTQDVAYMSYLSRASPTSPMINSFSTLRAELMQQGLPGACMERIYAARHDTRYNRQCLVGSQRHHWRCMHEKRRPKTRAWAGELRRQARKKEHVRARRQAGVIPSIASSEFEKTHPQLVHTQPRTGVDLRCRCHSSCTVVCRFEV